MKSKQSSKKEFTNDHRKNYQTYNSSNIFDKQSDSRDHESARASLQKSKSKNTFVPKYKDQTAFQKRLEEFYSKDKEDLIKSIGAKTPSSKGCILKEAFGSNKNKDNSNLSAREKKILDNLNSEGRIEEVKNLKKVIPFFHKNSCEGKVNNLAQTPKERRWNDLNSNIFNDQKKTEENTLKRNKSLFFKRDVINKIEHEKEDEKRFRKTDVGLNVNGIFKKSKSVRNMASNFDWSKNNTEIMFEKNENDNKSNRRHLVSNFFDSVEKKNFVAPVTSKEKEESKNLEQIIEKVGSRNLAHKINNLTSSLQSRNYITESYSRGKTQDKPIENYEIIAKSGYDQLEPQEIKYLFTRKGIHIYDFQEKGKYTDGFKSGNILFKIRKSEDPEFQSKISEINEKISKLGMKLNHNPVNTNKPISDLVSNKVAWNNTNLDKISKNRIEKNIAESKKIKIPPAEKLSNHVIQASSAYKNSYHTAKNIKISKK